MKKMWHYKKFHQPEKQNLRWALPSYIQIHLSTETILLCVIALLLLLLVWVTSFNNHCYQTHSEFAALDAKSSSMQEEASTHYLKHLGETEDEGGENQVNSVRSRMSSDVLDPFMIFKTTEVETSEPYCIADEKCTITCYDYAASNFHDMIDFMNTKFQDCDRVKLTITGTNFGKNVLESGWMKDINMDIDRLSLINNFKCNAAHIGKKAFSGDPFDSLSYLTIEEPDLTYLEKKVFGGSRVATLEIRHNQMKAIRFEADVFRHLRTTLVTLQLQRCLDGSATLRNITGSDASSLSVLIELDLRLNVIPELTYDSFTNIGMVESIFLDYCAIEMIDVHAFDSLRQLKQLYLANNRLSTLQDQTFSHAVALVRINLENNPWICDCHLAWLKHVYVKQRSWFLKPLFCGKIEFNLADFTCSSSSTETTPIMRSSTTPPATTSSNEMTTATSNAPTTTSTPAKEPTDVTTAASTATSSRPSRSPTTKNPKHVLRVRCAPLENIDTFDGDDVPELQLRRSDATLSFVLKDEDNSVSCYIKLEGDVEGEDMIFLLRDLSNDQFSCYSHVSYKSMFKVRRLDYDTSYSGCLLVNNKTDANPYNCIAIATPSSYGQRAWLKNESKETVIIGLVVASVVFILLCVLIIFCCLRQHPKLAVDSNADITLSRTSEYQAYSAPSYRSVSDGYMTPKSVRSEKHYEMPISPPRYRRKSLQIDYQAPGYIRRYSFMRRRNSTHNSEHLYEIPPPLPPNHPKGERYMKHPDVSQFM